MAGKTLAERRARPIDHPLGVILAVQVKDMLVVLPAALPQARS
jgi:hypothetical protein